MLSAAPFPSIIGILFFSATVLTWSVGAGAVRAEQEVDLVFLDQLLGQRRALLRIALVVVVLRLDLVVLAADLDAAGLVVGVRHRS